MKTILLRTLNGKTEAIGGADSAVLRPGEPVFVPDPVEQWQSIVAPAIRISRLGMNIKPAFARQHYHEIAAVHLLMPRTVGPIPPLFCDRAIAPGKWLDIDSLSGKSFNASIATFDDDNTVTFSMPLCFSDLKADEAVHFVSRYMTLKTGDMIVFGDNALDLGAPSLDTMLSAEIMGMPSLDIKFK